MKTRLFTPGPTPVPEKVALRTAQPIIHHRTAEFRLLLERVEKRLRYVFQTEREVFVLAASGTGAMEAAVANVLHRSARALTVEAGKFGERWGELCVAYGVAVERKKLEWGRALTPAMMEQFLAGAADYDAVFLTHSETSTGVAVDLQAVSEVIRKRSNALIVVDGITAVAAIPLKMDEWGVDVVVSGSQKGFMCPPGLSFIACSERAWKAVERGDLPRYYFDLRKAKKSLADQNTPFTPAISLLAGLDEALAMIEEEGIEQVWRRHARLAKGTREAVKALHLPLLAERPSDALTAVVIPDELLDKNLVGGLKKRGFVVAGGQAKLKGKIFRISHLGYYDEEEMLTVLSALEEVLLEVGWPIEPGTATTAFRKTVSEME